MSTALCEYTFEQIAINSKEKKKPTAEDYPVYLGLENLDSQDLQVTRFNDDAMPSGEKLIMRKGDVLFGKRRAYQKKVAIAPFDGIFSAHGMVLRPKTAVVDPEFFPFFISSDYFLDRAIAISVGSLSPTVNWGDLRIQKFNLPPIEEQHKAAALLWKIDTLEHKYRKAVAMCDEVMKAKFVEMFGDPLINPYGHPEKKLRELSSLITKGASPNWQGFAYTTDITQTLFITSENIREGFIDLSNKKYIDDEFNLKQNRSILKNGDFLINIVGASIGRAARFNKDCKANINQAVALVRLKESAANEEYLLYYLNSDKAINMYNSMKSDVARANLSLKDIGDIPVLFPDITLQNQFADFIEKNNTTKISFQISQSKLKSMKRSLINQIFTPEA